VNAGRATDCGRTLRVASYGAGGGGWDVLWWRAGLEEEVPKRRKKKKKRRNAPNSAGKDVLHPPSNFFFFLDFSFSFLSSLSLHFFLRSFVCSFLSFFFVIGMSWSASFRHSFGGHQGRSSFSSPFFPIPSRRPNGNGNSAQKLIEREFRFEKILASNLIHGGV
jgi:hypothetical protein